MKIGSSSPASRFINRVRERGDSGGNSGSQHHGGREQDPGERGQGPPEVSEDEVKAAVEAFGSDEQAVAAGLHVDQVGTGPGLRVVLRDVSGNVLRQFSGSEFVKLREVAGGRTLHAPGKILDRKL